MTPTLRALAMSDPDYEDFICEGYVNDECFVIVSQDNGFQPLDVEFLRRPTGEPWKLKYDDVIGLLDLCRNRLWELRRQSPDEPPPSSAPLRESDAESE